MWWSVSQSPEKQRGDQTKVTYQREQEMLATLRIILTKKGQPSAIPSFLVVDPDEFRAYRKLKREVENVEINAKEI